MQLLFVNIFVRYEQNDLPVIVHQSTLYLFQLLYRVVFGLEDLQHLPVLYLSFVLLTGRKQKK